MSNPVIGKIEFSVPNSKIEFSASDNKKVIVKPHPTLGRIVLYRLSPTDKEQLRLAGSDNPNNGANEAPAVIVRVWGETCVNLRVLVDGPQNLWVTSRLLGDQVGEWSWPVITPPAIKTPDDTAVKF